MAVNQPLDMMFFHLCDHRMWVDVHDFQRFAAVSSFAVGSHSGGHAFANTQRQGEEQRLQPALMDFCAKCLITRVIGAQRIAVQDKHPATVQIEHFFLGEQRHAAFAGEAFANQEVTITVNKETGDAGINNRFNSGSDFTM